ncbi:effector-associated domain EAD1-containing protein [Frankia sp. AgKG'84/4]|uniref:effector-associated domain EAD1-containing protein n=1 Tax=Frankia sp. AgKG'84/4 TaxID=573490 RepID=UPI00200CDA30|nr:effector-associated domain EAD1-containing protein [Frankia sp. AgKG'84/4]MCL9793812.1 effector-associated domain EAD1-containing protein [Frankia sp. AgKG'84/4]
MQPDDAAGGRPDTDGPDIRLAPADRDAFLAALAATAADEHTIRMLLARITFPMSRVPFTAATPLLRWSEVFRELDNGVIAVPYRRLLTAALDQWRHHPTFTRLRDTYLADPEPEPDPAPSPAPPGPGEGTVCGGAVGRTSVPRSGRRHPGWSLISGAGIVAVALLAGLVWALARPERSCDPTSGKAVDARARLPTDGDISSLTVTTARFSLDTARTPVAHLALSFGGKPPPGYRVELFSRQVTKTEEANSVGRSTAGDGVLDGNGIYRPAAAIRTPTRCWRQTVTLGTPNEIGIIFGMFVVLLDEQAYESFVRSPARVLYEKNDLREGPGRALFVSEFSLRT